MGPIVGAVVYERLRGSLLTSAMFRDLHVVVSGVLLLVIVSLVGVATTPLADMTGAR